MKMLNQVKITFAGRSVNEGFARAALAAFLVQLDPTVPQLADMKTAVSEAVTNCIVHAYPDKIGPITMTAAIYEGGIVRITITDRGVGIPDIAKAMEPMFTTGDAEERAAEYIRSSRYPKPVFGFIAGLTAPPGKRMGHAGAIISGTSGRGEDKIAAFEEAGVTVIRELGSLGSVVAQKLL